LNTKSVEKKEKNEIEIIIEVSPEEFETVVGKAFLKNKNRISVPGFRKGKASRKIIERMYGASVFHPDALDLLLPEVMDFATSETDQKLVGVPRVADVDIKEDTGGAEVKITAAIYPEVKLGEYKGLAAVRPSVEIPDSAVDAEIAGVRMRNARIEKADRPAISGDISVIDFEGFLDGVPFDGGKGENYELELGSKAFIPGFEDKVIGMTIGEERDIDLVFPEGYQEKTLAGKAVVFKVKLHDLKEKLLPELDDEFAKDVSEFDTLDEYKADIKERLQIARQGESDSAFENALLDKLVESMEADVPDVMIEEQMDIAASNFARQVSAYGMDPASYLKIMNMTPELFRENIRVSSEKQVKITLALEKVAELEGIEASDDDIENEYKDAAERFGVELEQLKGSIEKAKVIQEIKTRLAAKIVTDNGIAQEPPASGDGETDAPSASGDTEQETPVVKPKRASAKKAEADSGQEAAEPEKQKKPAARKPAAKKPKGDEQL